MEGLKIITPYLGLLSLVIAWIIYRYIKKQPNGTNLIRELEIMIHEGSMEFLKREFFIFIVFMAVMFVLLGMILNEWKTSLAFMTGAFCSMFAGFSGMAAATRGNSRTANAADKSDQSMAQNISYLSGSVPGFGVVGFALLGIGLWLRYCSNDPDSVRYIYGLALGAGSVALFLRVGGGIYTKAVKAGVGLSSEIEAGIPEEDHRNPGVIAENVGDNVRDIAGLGVDLFESYVGSIIATIAIGATLSITPEFLTDFPELKGIASIDIKLKYMSMPIIIVMAGLISSFGGVFSIRYLKDRVVSRALRYSTLIADGILIILIALSTSFFNMPWGTFWAMFSGLLCGILIGLLVEYYTTGPRIKSVAERSRTGPAAVIIEGLAIGMQSTFLPVLCVCAAAYIGFKAAGIYGIGLSAVGMLSTTGTAMTLGSYSPIVKNACSISRMAGLGTESRKIADNLHSLGKTTEAIARGFGIGAATLTSLALFIAYTQLISLEAIDIANPTVFVGLFIGGIIPMVCAALTMKSAGRAAFSIVDEIRRQFREIPGLLEGKEGVRPDSKKCVSIATNSALKEMVTPGLIILLTPIAVGFLLGREPLGGMLLGSMVMGFILALFMAIGGGAWDNAKKYIEDSHLGGKGSDNHFAVSAGDTVGNAFIDSSGSAMSVIIKLMPVISLVVAPILPLVGLFS